MDHPVRYSEAQQVRARMPMREFVPQVDPARIAVQRAQMPSDCGWNAGLELIVVQDRAHADCLESAAGLRRPHGGLARRAQALAQRSLNLRDQDVTAFT